ncbi:hypothetical protein [Haloglomus salinum]|uniref:hypothetical protein n=1 Tax=Haloglomus salinum TaxID=2962673 RepID=UPI0020C9848A|nr:hypothetical protein [Haloglomus salinum]
MSPDRQALAVAGAVALLLAGVCGAAVVLSYEPPPPEPYEPTENVPAGTDYVGTLNTTEYRSDPAVRNGTRASLRFQSAVQFYDGPPYLRALAVSPPSNASLNTSAASQVTYFGRSGEPYGARLVVANWTASDATEALRARHSVEFTTETRRGFTIYRSDRGPAVAVLDNGAEGGPIPREGPRLLAIGNESAVSDAVDVAIARADPETTPETVGGELLRRYDGTDDGYVRFAYRFRPSTVPDYPFVGPAVRTVEYVGTRYTLNETAAAANETAPPDVRVRIRITSEDAESADDVRNIMSAGKSFYLLQSSNATLKTELRRTAFDIEGRTLLADYESSPSGLRVLVRGLFRNQPEPQSLARPSPAIDTAHQEPA